MRDNNYKLKSLTIRWQYDKIKHLIEAGCAQMHRLRLNFGQEKYGKWVVYWWVVGCEKVKYLRGCGI